VLPRRYRLTVGVLAASLVLSGCSTPTVVPVQASATIPKGHELTDLVRALDEGAITQREYDWLRDRIQRRPY
jgi:hypothetical protein